MIKINANEIKQLASMAGDYGYKGSRKACISKVYTLWVERYNASWAEFKTALLDAHKHGRLTLGEADFPEFLSPVERLRVITHLNARFHFVRY